MVAPAAGCSAAGTSNAPATRRQGRGGSHGGTVRAVTTPPQARQQPHEHTEHGVRRPDPYHWMRDLDSPDLLAHLEAELGWYDPLPDIWAPSWRRCVRRWCSRVPRY